MKPPPTCRSRCSSAAMMHSPLTLWRKWRLNMRPRRLSPTQLWNALRQPLSLSTGVWPRRAHVFASFSRNDQPTSSKKMTSSLSRRDFFYPGAVLREPGADQLFVAPLVLALGLLPAPAALTREAAEAARVVADRELPLDESLDARQRPALAVESGGRGPGIEPTEESLLLLRRQLARPARRRRPAQGPLAAFIEPASPRVDGGGGDAEAPGDLALRELALLQQACRFEAAFFKLCACQLGRCP